MIFATGYFQPALIRNDFYAIYWFNKELARIVYSTREKPLGLGKLDFWQESIENIYKARAADPGRDQQRADQHRAGRRDQAQPASEATHPADHPGLRRLE